MREDWLNNGPSSLVPLLPNGWRERVQKVYEGQALQLWTLGRFEFLLTKLWALCDRGLDLGDCMALSPSPDELQKAMAWVEAQDAHLHWPQHVQESFTDLSRRLGHGI